MISFDGLVGLSVKVTTAVWSVGQGGHHHSRAVPRASVLGISLHMSFEGFHWSILTHRLSCAVLSGCKKIEQGFGDWTHMEPTQTADTSQKIGL